MVSCDTQAHVHSQPDKTETQRELADEFLKKLVDDLNIGSKCNQAIATNYSPEAILKILHGVATSSGKRKLGDTATLGAVGLIQFV